MKQTEWEEVSKKRNNHVRIPRISIWTAKGGKVSFEAGDTVASFFFTKFPENFEAKDMFEIFKAYGIVMEVTIPAKRGKIFGFVRFKNVGDTRLLALKLDNIII
ncbi:unnamed protein product [Lathyrus sativus]|nr:unnamed protein product [Lathyrus sativus]